MAPLNCSELSDIVTEVLSRIEIPVSLTLINTSLKSLLKRSAVSENFLIENGKKFSLSVIGCDLKILLRQKSEVKKNITRQCEKANRICSVIDKDIRKLKELEDIFKKENKTEILYDDFITKYNSKKRKINIAFITRNSHSLQIFCRNQQTYIRFVNKSDISIEMGDEEIFDILKSNDFEVILVRCLKRLLSCFVVPINLGSLQCCFSLGNALIDKDFLRKYTNFFQGSGEAGIQLKHEARKELDKDENKYTNSFQGSGEAGIQLKHEARKELDKDENNYQNIVLTVTEANKHSQETELANTKAILNTTKSELTTNTASKLISAGITLTKLKSALTTIGSKLIATESTVTTTGSPLTTTKLNNTDKQEIMLHVQNAVKDNKSLVIVGEGDKDALLFDPVGTDDSRRLIFLKNMQEIINKEIQKTREQKYL